VYITGEAIRGLADLEAKERERCANFATKAIAAGLAERTVGVAERQGQLMVEMVQAALREVDLSPDQTSEGDVAAGRVLSHGRRARVGSSRAAAPPLGRPVIARAPLSATDAPSHPNKTLACQHRTAAPKK
jgi:hypothetical protein